MSHLDFSRRAELSELMDTEEYGFEDYRAAMADLARVNALTRTHAPTIDFLERLAARGLPVERPWRIVDVGAGQGDMLRRIDTWALSRGIAVELIGVDRNPLAARAAAVACEEAARPIHWITGDISEVALPGPIDVVLSAQVTHHLADAALIRFLAWMEETAVGGWFVSDLHRHPLPYHVFRLWARAARWHRFVQNDGPVSIRRAFRAADWRRLLAAAGLAAVPVELGWWMPFRLCLARFRP